jgi:hypothetical protein
MFKKEEHMKTKFKKKTERYKSSLLYTFNLSLTEKEFRNRCKISELVVIQLDITFYTGHTSTEFFKALLTSFLFRYPTVMDTKGVEQGCSLNPRLFAVRITGCYDQILQKTKFKMWRYFRRTSNTKCNYLRCRRLF